MISLSTFAFAQETQTESTPLTIGLAADPQAADKPAKGTRNYRGSKAKLTEFVSEMNRLQPRAAVILGDLVDDSEEMLFEVILKLSGLHLPFFAVAGNHDFEAFAYNPQQTYGALTMPAPWFREELKSPDDTNWRLLFIDGNRMSLHAWPKNSSEQRRSKKYHKKWAPDSPEWNGGIGEDQLLWLKLELQEAQKAGDPVIIFCHYPIYPENNHNLWDSGAILEILESRSCVKAWISGHNHAGNYAEYSGVHHITLKGMVEGESNPFALMSLYPDRLEIKGFGPQQDYSLPLRVDE